MRYRPLAERFEEKVGAPTPEGCLPWVGARDGTGYGFIKNERGNWPRSIRAHRAAYLIRHGEIPDGLCVCHHCDNRWCVNVLHLFLGTYQDNRLDAMRKGRAVVFKLGADHPRPMAKLNDNSVLAIRRLAARGITQGAIAQQFGTSQPTISLIVNRRTWNHI